MNEVINEFYKSFYPAGIENKKKTKYLKDLELYNLYQKPKKEKGLQAVRTNRASIQPESVYQADVLFMPEDPSTKDHYILTVADISAKGKTDAYPFKELNATNVLKGFKTIFARGILPLPKYQITLDKGSEFKNKQIEKYFTDKGIFIKFSQTGRSRQIAFAEYRNKVIAKALFMRMTGQELITDEPSLHWVADLPKIVQAINNHAVKVKVKKFSDLPNITNETIILSIGTPVRIQLDKPKEVYQNQKLNGRFRETDVRWTSDVYTVADVILDGGQPPLYRVKNIDGKLLPVAYTLNQLQVVKSTEQEPPADKVIRGTPSQYVVKAIKGRKKEKGKIFYLVSWKGYPNDDTYEPYSELKKVKKINEMIEKWKKENENI